MPVTRRDVLRGATVLGVASALPTASLVAAPEAEATTTSTSWVLPLLQRATYGATPGTLSAAAKLGSARAWVDQQLAPSSFSDPEGDAVRALYPELSWSITTTRAKVAEFQWDAMFALGQATIALAAWSRRQLFEMMVEFWSNHLNVTNPSDSVWASRPDYDRNVIRRYALGKFSDMLVASATHPAMLTYLNQAESTKAAPNENYGRELLELHTVGINGGYTEAMVKDSARIFTGWTVNDSTGLAVYDSSEHWTGPVRVLGFTHANSAADGRAVATAYLRYLAHHPKTAQTIARKLAIRFHSDNPPQTLVDALAKTYLASDTDIKPVLRQLLTTTTWSSSTVKIKRPYEDVISTIRTLGITLLPTTAGSAKRRAGVESLYWMLDGMRHTPMSWGLPNGYPDVAQGWQAADIALARWNAHQNIAAAWWPDRTQLSIPSSRRLLPATLPTTYGGLIDALCSRLVHHLLDTRRKGAVLTFMGASSATQSLPSNSEWLGWRLPYLVALILDAPNFAVRS